MLLSSCHSSRFDPPERLGPPAVVTHENEPHLWLLLKQEERKKRHIGSGSRSLGNWVTEIHFHFELQCHDPRTSARLWKKRLLTVKEKEGGRNAEARILGQDGDVVWLFLHDQPVAFAPADGTIVANRKEIEQRNLALQGLIPKELNFYAFDNGLVITTADARRHKVRAADYAAELYKPESDDHFRGVQFRATQWNGGYRTGDFLTRQATLGGRWLGFYSEKEAADAADDGFGDTLKNPDSVFNEGSRARRSFWTARIGKTKEFTEGSHDRLFDVTRVPAAPDFLEAGFVVAQGTKQPLTLHDPEGLLVLHRTRLDAEGRLALTRLDESLRPKWDTTLPFLELGNRYELPDRLLFYGAVSSTEKGVTQAQELIVATDLSDGRTQAWNVTLERSVAAEELEKREP
ncbi:MAG: hypothetical protein M3Q89_06030 [Verrucomicrobiota bacterium]|nr:hypothetical protein [Verrucomicrobiota bacterium]